MLRFDRTEPKQSLISDCEAELSGIVERNFLFMKSKIMAVIVSALCLTAISGCSSQTGTQGDVNPDITDTEDVSSTMSENGDDSVVLVVSTSDNIIRAIPGNGWKLNDDNSVLTRDGKSRNIRVCSEEDCLTNISNIKGLAYNGYVESVQAGTDDNDNSFVSIMEQDGDKKVAVYLAWIKDSSTGYIIEDTDGEEILFSDFTAVTELENENPVDMTAEFGELTEYIEYVNNKDDGERGSISGNMAAYPEEEGIFYSSYGTEYSVDYAYSGEFQCYNYGTQLIFTNSDLITQGVYTIIGAEKFDEVVEDLKNEYPSYKVSAVSLGDEFIFEDESGTENIGYIYVTKNADIAVVCFAADKDTLDNIIPFLDIHVRDGN